jgi:predicted TPR repeat methyltransferase
VTDSLACPDPIAERRFAYAQGLAKDRDYQAAAEVYEQALELVPDWAPAWVALGKVRERLSDRQAAAAAYAQALRADPADRQGAGPRIAWLEGRDTAALPPAYVARLFDDYAPKFEEHLIETLLYCGHELMATALDRVAPGRRFRLGLDLGCGSGLAGRVLRDRVERLVGVDLAPAMIALARDAGGYDELVVGDLVGFLSARPPGAADLAFAADAFCYCGDLTPVFAAAAAALAPGGLFAFTVESGAAPFALQSTLRFQHSDAHVGDAAARAGLRVAFFHGAYTRREGPEGVLGRLVALVKG